jgi:hypothetical protein
VQIFLPFFLPSKAETRTAACSAARARRRHRRDACAPLRSNGPSPPARRSPGPEAPLQQPEAAGAHSAGLGRRKPLGFRQNKGERGR